MAQQGLRNPIRQAADDIANSEYQLPEFERPERQGLSGGTPDRPDGTPDSSLLPPPDLEPLFLETAEQHGVPPNVLMAIAQQESGYQVDAVGQPTEWGRAKGMMQYIDPTAESMGINPLDPQQALSAAAKQLRQRLDNGYSMQEAVMAHFGGDDRSRWGSKTRQYGQQVLGKAGRIYDMAAPAQRPAPQQESLRAFGESGIPYAPVGQPAAEGEQGKAPPGAFPESSPAAQGLEVDAYTGAARQAMTAAEASAQSRASAPGNQAKRLEAQRGDVERPAGQQDGAPSFNTLRGAGERVGDLAGGLMTAIHALSGASDVPLGGRAWQGDADVTDERERLERAREDVAKMAETSSALELGYVPEHTWESVKTAFSEGGALSGSAWSEVMRYGAEQGIKSVPDMVAAGLALPAYVVARSGEIGQTRAENDGREQAALTDVLAAAPFALGSAILERIGAKGIASAGSDAAESVGRDALKRGVAYAAARVAGEGAKAGGKEAGTEFVQEGIIEYVGERFGTEAAMSFAEAAERGAAGAVAGGTFGGATGAGVATAREAGRANPEAKLGRELNRNISASTSQGVEEQVLASQEPDRQQGRAGEQSAPDADPDPMTYQNSEVDQAQWEQAWEAFDRENPGARLDGEVGTTPQPAPSGPIDRAVREAEQQEQLDATEGQRVVVKSRTGDLTGTVQRYREDGRGGFQARILGDDGMPYQFSQDDDVKIVREEAVGQAPQAPQEVARDPEGATGDAGDAGPVDRPVAQPEGAPQASEEQAPARRQLTLGPKGKRTVEFPSDEDATLFDRAQNLRLMQRGAIDPNTDQAKQTNAWVETMRQRLGVSHGEVMDLAADYRQSVMELAKQGERDGTVAIDSFEDVVRQSGARRQKAAETQRKRRATQQAKREEAQAPAEPSEPALPRELSGAKPRYSYGDKAFSLDFASDIDKAAYIAAQKTPSKRDGDYVAFAADATGMSEAEVRAHGQRVREAIKGQARDAEPGTLSVPGVSREPVEDNEAGTSPVVDNEAPETSDNAPEVTVNGEEVVTHTTKKGKTIQGVVRGIPLDDAKRIDPYAFRKDGGSFIRLRRLGEQGEIAKGEATERQAAPAARAPESRQPASREAGRRAVAQTKERQVPREFNTDEATRKAWYEAYDEARQQLHDDLPAPGNPDPQAKAGSDAYQRRVDEWKARLKQAESVEEIEAIRAELWADPERTVTSHFMLEQIAGLRWQELSDEAGLDNRPARLIKYPTSKELAQASADDKAPEAYDAETGAESPASESSSESGLPDNMRDAERHVVARTQRYIDALRRAGMTDEARDLQARHNEASARQWPARRGDRLLEAFEAIEKDFPDLPERLLEGDPRLAAYQEDGSYRPEVVTKTAFGGAEPGQTVRFRKLNTAQDGSTATLVEYSDDGGATIRLANGAERELSRKAIHGAAGRAPEGVLGDVVSEEEASSPRKIMEDARAWQERANAQMKRAEKIDTEASRKALLEFENAEIDLPDLKARLDEIEKKGAPKAEDKGKPEVADLPRMANIGLKRNGQPFADAAMARKAINNRKLKDREPVKVVGGYGIAPADMAATERALADSLNDRQVRLLGDGETITLEDYSKRKSDALAALADNVYSATGFNAYTLSGDAIESALGLIESRNAIVDDWRGAAKRDGILDRPLPDGAETVESGTGQTVTPGQVLDGASYIEEATGEYVATRRVDNGRVEPLAVTPKASFERAQGVKVAKGNAPAPVASDDNLPPMDERATKLLKVIKIGEGYTREDAVRLADATRRGNEPLTPDDLQRGAGLTQGKNPIGPDADLTGIFARAGLTAPDSLSDSGKGGAEASAPPENTDVAPPAPAKPKAAPATPEVAADADGTLRPEGRKGWRTEKAAFTALTRLDGLGRYEPRQEDGTRWVLQPNRIEPLVVRERERQAMVGGEKTTVTEIEVGVPGGIKRATFERVLRDKAPKAKLRQNGFATVTEAQARAIADQLGVEINDQREGVGETGAPPVFDARREARKRDTRRDGREAGLDGDAREVPEWFQGDEELENEWLVGYGEGLAERSTDGGVQNADATMQNAETPAASANTIFTEDAAEKARALLKSKLGTLNSGIDPEIMQAGITLAGYHIEKGARSFAAYARAMTDDLGETVKPYLKSWYMGVKYDPRATGFEGMDDAATVEAADVDTITNEEPSDARQSDAAGRDAPQATGARDTGQREPGDDSQQGDSSPDSGNVEAGTSDDVEAAQGTGRGRGTRGGGAAADVGAPRAADGQRDADERGATDRGAGASDTDAGGRGRDGGDAGGVARDPETISPANPGPGNFRYDDPLEVVGGGQVARFKKNQAAIETYLTLRDEAREATREEQEVLAGYTGWGSFGQELFQGTWANPQPKKGWEDRDQWLRDHLGEAEWKGMQRSIINAHYTDPPTVMAMWSMLERMGFDGGRVLEPSMGIGNFFGMMPETLANRSQLTGVELDPLTGGMAQKLYPEAGIRVMGYQESKTPDDFYDVVIGNWPFENSPIADRRYNKLNPMVHDYFFLKTLDQVRPGGIVMGITSAGSLDKKDATIRRELAKKGELVAAYRLPSGAFKEYAGTNVVTDIVILRKRPERLADVSGEGWIQSTPMATKGGTEVSVNEYFHANPDKVLGEIDFGHGTTSGRPGMIVHRPRDMQAALDRIVAEVPKDGYRQSTRDDSITYVTNHTDDREGALTRTGDGFHIVRGEQLAPAHEVAEYRVKSAKTTADREAQFDKLIGLRQAYAALIEAERDVDADSAGKRKALKRQYDAFVKAHGPLNGSYGLKYLRKVDDPFAMSLAALERKDGEPAAILERSTIRTPKRLDNPSVEDAYVLARNGDVNPTLEKIATLAKVSPEEARQTLMDKGAIFETAGGDIVPSDIYLSGNVRHKLRDAEAALAEGNTAMQRNVEALKEAMPADIPYFNIEVQMGASWVPTGVYEEFIAHMLNVDSTDGISVRYTQGRWKARVSQRLQQRQEARSGFGTDAYGFGKLVNAAISNQTVTIKTKDSDGKEHIDREKTDKANNAIAKMRESFGEWLWSDGERRHAMEVEYNEVRNAYASPRYDGSFLRLDGMALQIGSSEFNLRAHQQDAIWRALVTRKSINAHEVGTGKSFTIAGIAVESRRYGLAKKPLILGHNANSASLAKDINVMYPAAKVLYIDNLKPSEIDVKLRQIANDDWDAVVLPHSQIDRLAFTEETLMRLAQEDIEALEREAAEAAAEEGGGEITQAMLEDESELKKLRSPTAKALVKQRNRIIEGIKKQAQRSSRANAVTFEELGIDMVLVDEVHEFKKPPITTKMRVKGLQTDVSQRSTQLKFMTDYIRGQNGGGNVHTFTGTPITNTLTEIFHQMRYIMKEDMEESGVEQWDGWFGSFAKEVQDVELNGAGEWETVSRLRGFINVPELRKLVGQYMDVVFADDMPEMQPRQTASGKTLTDPSLTEAERDELLNGYTEDAKDRPYKKVETDTADLTPNQKRILEEQQALARSWQQMNGKARKEAMHNGAPEVPIQIEAKVAKASFDARLVNDVELAGQEGQVPDEPSSKLSRAIDNVMAIYRGDPRATQVVFSNTGLGKSATRSERDAAGNVVRDGDGKIKKKTVRVFSSMHDMVERLVQQGIPREQIAIVDGGTNKAKRAEIAEAMNRSEIRVVIGSTQSLGVGVNMQKNLRAMHHLDAPYMPGDLEQRNGRGHRQGNQWNTVREFRYITDRLDGRRWQILSIKQQFITDFLKADGDTRVIEGDAADSEESDILSTFSEAAGDPRVLIRTKLKSQLEQLQKRERLHQNAIRDAKREAAASRERLARLRDQLGEIDRNGVSEAVAAALKANAGKAFSMEVDGTTHRDRKEADEAITAYWKQNVSRGDEPHTLGQYGDLEVAVKWDKWATDPHLIVTAKGEQIETASAKAASLEATLRNWPAHVEKMQERVTETERSIERLDEVVQQPFARADKLEKTKAQLEAVDKDLETNPVPPPAWLRNGAPVDTEVVYQGETRTVTGHRWNDKGWFVLSQDSEGAEIEMPYREVADEQGMRLYDERPFEAPSVGGKIPKAIMDRYKPGMRTVVTDPETGEEMAGEVIRAPYISEETREPAVMVSLPDGRSVEVPAAAEEAVAKSVGARGSHTPASLRAALRNGRQGQLAGRMLDQGKVAIHRDVAATGRSLPGDTAAYVDRNNRIHLIAGNIAPGNEFATLMHEAFHATAQPLVGSAEWGRLHQRLRRLYHQADRSNGRFNAFLNEARARVDQAKTAGDSMTPVREIEEFGAYALEQYERAPTTLRKWVDDLVGAAKEWLRTTLGIQLGRTTPAQLRAMTLAGMRRQVAHNGGTPTPARAEEGPRLSVDDLSTKERNKAGKIALEEAIQALEENPSNVSVGRVVGDMGRVAKFMAHPRTVASLHKSFEPVYQTGIKQFEMRDAIIDDLHQHYRAYTLLNRDGKGQVNKVLELGRLLGETYTREELTTHGVMKPATKPVPKFDAEGTPYIDHEPLHAELTDDNEVVKLSGAEADAYLALREMFDTALDMFRDQTLDDYGLSEFKGLKNSAGAILDSIDDSMDARQVERRQQIARFMNEIEQAKRTGYVPFSRYGDYVITVKEKRAELDYVKDPQGGWIVRDVPESLETFLGEIDATYDELEGGWRLDRARKQALDKENERTVYATKVETGLRDIWAKRKTTKAANREDVAGAKLDNIPAVRDEIARVRREWAGNNPLRQVRAFPTAKVSQGGTVSLSELDALAEISSIDNATWDAVRDQLADTIKGQSFRKHFFQADNVPGYSGDFERAITDYMGGMGGYLSRRHHMREWDDAIGQIKAPRLHEYATKYREYANSPQEEYAMLRQVGFLNYIAGNLATAFVNTTQVPVMTMPALSMVAGHTKAAYEVGRAYKDALKMYRASKRVGLEMFDPDLAPADVRDALKTAWGKGAFVPLETFEVIAASRMRHAGQRRAKRGFEKLVQGTAYVFTLAERLNRLVTFIASARLAKDDKVQAKARKVLAGNYHARNTVLKDWNPESFAEYIIDETQYRMGKANRPTVMRGIGAPIMQFKSFMLQTLETWYRWSTMQGYEGKMSAAASIAMMVSLGGLWGFPGAEDMRDLLERLWRTLTKEDKDLESDLRVWIYEKTGQRWLSDAVTKGLTYPAGLDMSRVGMGQIMPQGVDGVFGIPYDMFVGRPSRAFKDITNEQYVQAAGEFMPNFLRNVGEGVSWKLQGVPDYKGRPYLLPEEVPTSAAIKKIIGFQPAVVTQVRDYEWAQYRNETRIRELKRHYTGQLARRIAQMTRLEQSGGEPADIRALEQEVTDIFTEIHQHNMAASPEDIIEISDRTLNNHIERQLGGLRTTFGNEGRKAARGKAEQLREVYGLPEIFDGEDD